MATDSLIRNATFSVASADGGSVAEGGRPAEEINPCFEKRRSRLLSQPQSSRQLSRRPSRRRVVVMADTAEVMLVDMAAVTAVDAPFHGGVHSTGQFGGGFHTVGHLRGFHHAAHFHQSTHFGPGFRGAGIYAYYDDYGCGRWFPIRGSYRRVWVC